MDVAETLAEDIVILGLSGTSEAIREALYLLHRKAMEESLDASYKDFYGGQPAPISDVMAALFPELPDDPE